MSKVTVREASILTGVSRQTINSMTKDGTLSSSKNKRGHKVIDIAELSREFDIIESADALETSKKTSRSDSKVTVKSVKNDKEIQSIRQELISAQERERALWQEQITLLKETVEEIRKDKETYVRLIEHQGNAKNENKGEIDALKKANESLTEQVQKLLEKEEVRAQERMEARRKAREAQRVSLEKQRIEAEQSRGFLRKLFS